MSVNKLMIIELLKSHLASPTSTTAYDMSVFQIRHVRNPDEPNLERDDVLGVFEVIVVPVRACQSRYLRDTLACSGRHVEYRKETGHRQRDGLSAGEC